jgi:regulator of sigma E protease
MFVQNIGYTLLLLGILVFVHEFGHFIVAKALNVKVLRFSIGFGPRIFGFTKGETEYRVAWLPLGGYVKMAGELPQDELSPEEAKRGFLAQAPWKRALIVTAGPAFNLLFPILAYFLLFLGTHQQISTRIGSVEPGLPAAEAGLQPGDRILAVDGEKVRTFEELRAHLQPRYDRPITLTVERQGRQSTTTLTPAKSLETNPIETLPRGLIGISPNPKAPVLGVPEGSPAAAAGLKTFDRVLSVNGEPVKDELAFNAAIDKAGGLVQLKLERDPRIELPGVAAHVPDVVSVSIEKQPGHGYEAIGAERVDLYVARVIPGSAAEKAGLKVGDRIVALNGKKLKSFLLLTLALNELADKSFKLTWRSGSEEKTQELRQTALAAKDEYGQVSEGFDLGIRPLAPSPTELSDVEKVSIYMGPGEALGASLKVVPEIIRKTAQVLGYLVTGRVPFKSVGGPIMLYQIASKSAEEGIGSYLNAMAVISVNLGLINLFPIPVLDGFQLLASIWEAIRRRPIPARAREIANMIGLAMLIVLMVMVFKNDIMR